ncbi:hypothetical protein MIND_00774300 [Mycena indigotica]|uniref:MYND-type domain-containing protein n=1 Tax=Mycena indigotica TaxID=2126181 RepID=A0A8H6SME8_9AGAR|nr:uncharacterized protein MIND_00774300 [Mycena indigotica]KAF7302076.1 hypothetical protein MIND_00774300 [Mycena indigotica]
MSASCCQCVGRCSLLSDRTLLAISLSTLPRLSVGEMCHPFVRCRMRALFNKPKLRDSIARSDARPPSSLSHASIRLCFRYHILPPLSTFLCTGTRTSHLPNRALFVMSVRSSLADVNGCLQGLPNYVKTKAESLLGSDGQAADCGVIFAFASIRERWHTVWPVLFALLDNDRLPSYSMDHSSYSTEERIRLEISWAIVVEMAESNTLASVEEDIGSIWDRLWPWLAVFMQPTSFLGLRRPIDSRNIHSSVICLAVVARFIRHAQTHTRMSAGSNAVRLFVMTWVRCCDEPVRENRWSRLGLLAMYDLLRQFISTIPTHIHVIEEACGSSTRKIAFFCKQSFDATTRETDPIISDFAIVSVTCFWKAVDSALQSRNLRYQFVKQKVLGAAATALYTMVAQRDMCANREKSVGDILLFMLKISQHHWEFGAWTDAIASKAIDGTLLVMQRTESPTNLRITDMVFFGAIGRAIWRPALLRSIMTHRFNTALLLPTEALTTPEHRSLLNVFAGSLDRRLQHLREFPSKPNRRMCWTCGRFSSSGELKRCLTCKETYYCDTFCQRDHWPVHRLDCKTRKLSQKACHLDRETRRFLRHIMDEDFSTAFETLKDNIANALHIDPNINVVLLFDYRSPNFSVVFQTGEECARTGIFEDYDGEDITTRPRRLGNRIGIDVVKFAGQDKDYLSR